MKTISSSELVEVDIEAFTKIHNANEMNEDNLVEAIVLHKMLLKEANLTYEKHLKKYQKKSWSWISSIYNWRINNKLCKR